MLIDRAEFLSKLESIQPGLSPKPMLEQSSCFVFSNGEAATFNEEVSCRVKVPVKFEAAVQAAPLLALLRRYKRKELNLDRNGNELQIGWKRQKSAIALEDEITLEVDKVEKPGKWRRITDEFVEAIDMVRQCAHRDVSETVLSCLHIHPKWVEASDTCQLMRYKLRTGIDQPTIVKRDSVKHVLSLGMTSISESDNWLHFKNPAGVVLSCRRYTEQYPSLSRDLKVEGQKIILPKGLGASIDLAEIFSSESDTNMLQIQLRPGYMEIHGEGITGWHHEKKKLQNYKGDRMEFLVAPELLRDLSAKHTEIEVTEDRIKVEGGKFTFVAALGPVQEEEPKEEEIED